MRDRYLNYLSYSHRIATCRRPLSCRLCHGYQHLARDCTRRHSPEPTRSGTTNDGQRQIIHVS